MRSQPQNLNVKYELVNLLYGQAIPAIFATLIVATLTSLVLYREVNLSVLYSWYAAMVCVSLLRFGVVKFYLLKNPSPAENHFWYRVFIFITLLGSMTWSFAGTLLIPQHEVYQTFIACTLAGVSGGAIPFFAASRLICALYVVPMLLPFAVWLFLQNDMPHQLLGAFTLLYLALLFLSSFRTHKAIYRAINLKFENINLIESLSTASKKMEKINQELQSEITERKGAEKSLRESEEQYRLVTDALPVLISYIDKDLIYRYNNKVHETWLGKPLTEITGRPVKEVIGSNAYAIFIDNYEKLAKKKIIHYETVMQFRNEEERYVSVTLISHVKDEEIKGLFSLVSDVTPRINYLATHDALTELPNRSLFNARFSTSLKRAQRHHCQVALLFLDLDHFKNINDTLGHDVGDQLLIKVAERIKNCLRSIDTLSRQGGDEFIILLEDISIQQIINIANRILDSCKLSFNLEGREIFITVSIGISVYPEDGKDMQILLRNADMAIYRAKEKGRNTFEFYTEELNNKMMKKHSIETKLRTALEKNEFLLYYQPILDIQTNQICGVESLIRWQNSELGMVSPTDFIPVAEEVGLIVPIGEWVIRNACEQKKRWLHENNLPLTSRTSINISARQFRENDLADMINSILIETGLSGEFLTLELTETLIMQDIEHSIRVVKALKDLGISIAIDDFGTGYSSFNYLRKFPCDNIKIDRSFITDVISNKEDASIVTAIIAMAHSLKMKVTAEGVETIEQYHFLNEQNCDSIQGYILSEPLSVPSLEIFLQTTYSAPLFNLQNTPVN